MVAQNAFSTIHGKQIVGFEDYVCPWKIPRIENQFTLTAGYLLQSFYQLEH